MNTITVGRKFNSHTCRRAICCRLSYHHNRRNNNNCPIGVLQSPNGNHHDGAQVIDKKDEKISNPINYIKTESSLHDKLYQQPTAEEHTPRNSVSHDSSVLFHSQQNKNICTTTIPMYSVNHPTVMGTSVYMDEKGMVESLVSSTGTEGQDVRFHSSQSFVTWLKQTQAPSTTTDLQNNELQLDDGDNDNCTTVVPLHHYSIECIDGSSGFLYDDSDKTDQILDNSLLDNSQRNNVSRVSTIALTTLFSEVHEWMEHEYGYKHFMEQNCSSSSKVDNSNHIIQNIPVQKNHCSTLKPYRTFQGLRDYKRKVSTNYEVAKDILLSKHPVFMDWRRRELEFPWVEMEER